MNNAYAWEGLAAFPVVAETLLEGMDEATIRRPTHPGRFSPLEVIAHMADWEPRLRGRAKSARENPGATVPVWDEGELAVENSYAAKDWREQLEVFRKARRETIAFFKGLSQDEFDLHFTHPEQGRRTIEDLVGMMLGHDAYHCRQLAEVGGKK